MATIPHVKPDPSGKFPDVSIDVANVNEAVIFDVAGWDYFTLQMVKDGGADVTSLVLKVQKSNDGAHPVDFASAVTQSVEGMTAVQTITCMGYVHATATTAGTSGTIRLHARVDRIR